MTQAMHRPATLDEVLALLARLPEAKLIAGGASLVAMINAKLVDPEALVSLSRVAELRGISEMPDGGLRVGAMLRHCDAVRETRFHGTLAVVREAAMVIANATVRNMGSLGGAIAHADPGLDYPPALVAAGATIEVASVRGRRMLPAGEFFVDWYTTALQSGEMIAAVHLPAPRPGVGLYHKFARVAGDYATASVALTMTRSAGSLETRVAIGACGPRPVRLDEADRMLSGNPGPEALREAGDRLVAAADPVDDVRGSAEYRRMLIPRMLMRAWNDARAGLDASK